MPERLDSPIIPVGSIVWAVLPDGDDRFFAVPVEYTGYTVEVTKYGKEYTHFAVEVGPDGEAADEDEEVIDISLLRWTEEDAIEAFKIAYPHEPIFGAIYQPDPFAIFDAAGV
jgi:hypothetical protein